MFNFFGKKKLHRTKTTRDRCENNSKPHQHCRCGYIECLD